MYRSLVSMLIAFLVCYCMSAVHAEDVDLPKDLQVGVLAINTTTSDFSPQLEGLKVRQEK